MGPTETGEYLEVICQGITRVTGGFSRYPLEDINKEMLSSGFMGNNIVLPEYIGGDRVGLLIGLKSIQTDPVLMFCLPSGLGVYKSPFLDIFGSRVAYGGPHQVFSQINAREGSQANMVMLAGEVSKFRDSIFKNSSVRL